MAFKNEPHLHGEQGQGQVKRYVHQPLTIDHYGIHATITENGKVIISSGGVTNAEGDVEYDEITVPASLIFKLSSLLKDTRTIKYLNVTEPESLKKEEK